MTNRLRLLSAVAVSLLTGSILTACSSSQSAAKAAVPESVKAPVERVQQSRVPRVLEAVGTVRAQEVAQLSAQVMGSITSVAVRAGDGVRRGQLLATIDDAQPQAGVDRAQAALASAEHEVAATTADYELAASTMKRYQSLYEKKSVSPHEFEEVSTRLRAASAHRDLALSGVNQAKAALVQARAGEGFTRIRAPFDGVVAERRVDPGALATPGAPLLTLESRGRYRLEASVDEKNLAAIRLGQSVSVAVDALGADSLAGKVVQIVPAADAASRSFIVKIELPANDRLRSGLFGRARFAVGERETVTLPRAAVLDRGQLQGVFVVGQDHIATLRYITLGENSGERVEVLSGLNAGDMVVTSVAGRELAGKRIEVQ